MSIIDDLISPFQPISLEKMEEVKLLNRMDSKFVFSIEKLPAILAELYADYTILEIGQVRLQRYDTIYFDTPGLQLYLNHHNGRMNRFKVRSRTYVDSGLCYFEIKFKTNKGRTRKERNKIKGDPGVIGVKQEQLLIDATAMTPAMLQPALRIRFSRITLVNRELTERVTIDTGLTFTNETSGCDFPGIAIAEVKQDRSSSSIIASVLHNVHVPGTRISKYCLGIASLEPKIRKNNFKQKLHYINKLNHDTCEANNDVPAPADAGNPCKGMPSAASRS
jgi:hypothetical protein